MSGIDTEISGRSTGRVGVGLESRLGWGPGWVGVQAGLESRPIGGRAVFLTLASVGAVWDYIYLKCRSLHE